MHCDSPGTSNVLGICMPSLPEAYVGTVPSAQTGDPRKGPRSTGTNCTVPRV